MTRIQLAFLALSLSCSLACAADRPPDPVDPAILAAPGAEHVPTLMAALNGSGCAPKHSDVGDALVRIGKPAVAPLVERLNGTSQWWVQLECVHLLGLMGPEAAEAEPDLARFLEEQHHALPQSYARASLAAVRNDPQGLVDLIGASHTNVVSYSLELLLRMGADAAPVIPALQEYAQGESIGRATRVARFLEDYEATVVLTAVE